MKKNKMIALVGVLLIIAAVILFVVVGQKAPNEAEEMEAARSVFCEYHDDVIAKDADTALELLHFKKENLKLRIPQRNWIESYPNKEYRITDFVKEREGLYKVTFDMNFSEDAVEGTSQYGIVNYVQKIDGKWYVVGVDDIE